MTPNVEVILIFYIPYLQRFVGVGRFSSHRDQYRIEELSRSKVSAFQIR